MTTAQPSGASPADTKQMLASLQDERDGVALYTALAELEKSPQLAEVYRRLAAVEGRHAERWQSQLAAAGVVIPPYKPSWRTATLIWLARRFGVGFVLPSVTAREQADAGKYQGIAGAADMSGDEISHARMLNQVTRSLPGGLEGSAIAQMEGRHKAGGGNALRAAVLGANDGLVSNMSLVMGVAGAAMSEGEILLTGVAGLIAGACSMALGEWQSVTSSRELYENEIRKEAEELAMNPEEERKEISLIYQSKGLPESEAEELSRRLMADQKSALDTLAREELGVDPDELGGSAWTAGATSFVLFSIGAIVPVLPYMVFTGWTAMGASLAAGGAGLFAIGVMTSLFTGRGWLFSGARQLLIGLAAAGITYGVGALFSATLT